MWISIDRSRISLALRERESSKSFRLAEFNLSYLSRALFSRFKVRKNYSQVESRLKMDSAFDEHELMNFFFDGKSTASNLRLISGINRAISIWCGAVMEILTRSREIAAPTRCLLIPAGSTKVAPWPWKINVTVIRTWT